MRLKVVSKYFSSAVTVFSYLSSWLCSVAFCILSLLSLIPSSMAESAIMDTEHFSPYRADGKLVSDRKKMAGIEAD